MMKSLMATFVVWYLAMYSGPAMAGDPRVHTWKELDERVTEEWSTAAIGETATVRELAKIRPGILREMIWLNDYPLLRIAGIAGLKQRDDADDFRKSLVKLLIDWNWTSGLTSQLAPYISEITNAQGDDAKEWARLILNEGTHGTSKPDGWVVVINLLDRRALMRSFDESKALVPRYEAMVIDCLLANDKLLTEEERQRVHARLQSLSAIPGIPRAIYCIYTTDSNELFIEQMKGVLADDSLPEDFIRALVKSKTAMIGELDLERLSLSERRRELINDLLQRAIKRG